VNQISHLPILKKRETEAKNQFTLVQKIWELISAEILGKTLAFPPTSHPLDRQLSLNTERDHREITNSLNHSFIVHKSDSGMMRL
jgi:hypothetical protein